VQFNIRDGNTTTRDGSRAGRCPAARRPDVGGAIIAYAVNTDEDITDVVITDVVNTDAGITGAVTNIA
jgi:hypothetical protein